MSETHNRSLLAKRSAGYLWCRFIILYSVFFIPAVAAAQYKIEVYKTPDAGLNFTSFANKLAGIANVIIPFLIGVAFVAIIWGIFRYVQSAGDAEKIAEGRKVIVYGIVAMFLMLSFWGFVMIITNTLFPEEPTLLDAPNGLEDRYQNAV